MTVELSRAERALHRRAGWACDAALEAGVSGHFRVWEQAGVLAVLATDPALGFLSTVSGVTRETVPAAVDLVDAADWRGVRPMVVVPTELGDAAERLLLTAGFVRAADRLLAIKRLTAQSSPAVDSGLVEVAAAGANDAFLDVLLAGYEVDGPVAAFIRAEHRLPMTRRFLAVVRGKPIAAAASVCARQIDVRRMAGICQVYDRGLCYFRLFYVGARLPGRDFPHAPTGVPRPPTGRGRTRPAGCVCRWAVRNVGWIGAKVPCPDELNMSGFSTEPGPPHGLLKAALP